MMMIMMMMIMNIIIFYYYYYKNLYKNETPTLAPLLIAGLQIPGNAFNFWKDLVVKN